MNSIMKSAKTYPLIVVLGSYLMSYDLNFDAHFVIRPVTSGFSMILLRRCSISMVIEKD